MLFICKFGNICDTDIESACPECYCEMQKKIDYRE